jgi:hypothetical protein
MQKIVLDKIVVKYFDLQLNFFSNINGIFIFYNLFALNTIPTSQNWKKYLKD